MVTFDDFGLTRRQALGAATAGVVVLAGCSSKDDAGAGDGKRQKGGVLKVSLSDTVQSEKLDPNAAAGFATENALVDLLFDPLLRLTPDYELEPGLAEKWDSNADFTRWQFTLRSEVTFHDGKPLTAADVVWTLRRLLDADTGSPITQRATRTMVPAGIKAIDKQTVEISLKGPDSLLPVLLAHFNASIVPENARRFTPDTTVGTGPFKLVSWSPATSWEVERNPDYWEPGLPYLDGVRQTVNTETAALVQGVTSGQFDVAGEVDFASARRFKDSGDAKLVLFPEGLTRVIIMDASVEPFTDERVRTAFKLAMNREVAKTTVYQGLGELTSDIFFAPSNPYYPPDLGVRDFDPERAKSLLAEAGHPDGIDIELISSTAVSGITDLAVTFSQNAKEAGINASVRQAAPDTYYDKIWLKEPFYTSYEPGIYPPDVLWYSYGANAAFNEAHIKVPAFDEIYARILRTGDTAEQQALGQEGFALAADTWGHIIPVAAPSPLLTATNVEGVAYDTQNKRPSFRKTYFTGS